MARSPRPEPPLHVGRNLFQLLVPILLVVLLAGSLFAAVRDGAVGNALVVVLLLAGAVALGVLLPWRYEIRPERLRFSFALRRPVVVPHDDALVWIGRWRGATVGWRDGRPGAYTLFSYQPQRVVAALYAGGYELHERDPRRR